MFPGTILFAMIESGLNPNAYSYAHASGVWQFISSTGKMYGLDRSYHIDERLDFEKSTRAAAAYLKDLYADSMIGILHLLLIIQVQEELEKQLGDTVLETIGSYIVCLKRLGTMSKYYAQFLFQKSEKYGFTPNPYLILNGILKI